MGLAADPAYAQPTVHGVRVGTVAALARLGMSEPRLKAWLGLSPNSRIWQSYMCNPAYTGD